LKPNAEKQSRNSAGDGAVHCDSLSQIAQENRARALRVFPDNTTRNFSKSGGISHEKPLRISTEIPRPDACSILCAGFANSLPPGIAFPRLPGFPGKRG
jgi:hypothetical protein